MLNERIENAMQFAARAHGNQMRKGTSIPYIVHPFAVAAILWQQNCPESVIIAGLLHDTLEDTDIVFDDIKDQFGKDVANIVMACTEPDKSAPWKTRKASVIERMRSADSPVKWVVCADKYHNLRSMAADFKTMGDALWSRFTCGYEHQKWYMQSMADALPQNLDKEDRKPMFSEFQKLVEQFFQK